MHYLFICERKKSTKDRDKKAAYLFCIKVTSNVCLPFLLFVDIVIFATFYLS